MNFSRAIKSTRVANAAAAAQTAVNSTGVDMKGFDSVAFVLAMGAITGSAVTSAKLQGSTDNSTWTAPGGDLEGSSVTIADDDDNQIFVLECDRPQFRYIRCVVSRATQDSVVDGIVAHQFKAQVEPVTQPATTTAEYNHAQPVGTA